MDKQDKNHDEEDEKDDDDIHHDEDKQYFLNVKKIQRSQNVDQYESAESSQNVDQDESAESSQKFDEGESAETFGEDVPKDVIGNVPPPLDKKSLKLPDARYNPYQRPNSDSVQIKHPLKPNEIKFGNELSESLRNTAVKFLTLYALDPRISNDRTLLASMILGEHDLSAMIQSLPIEETYPNVQDRIGTITPYSNTHFHSLLKTMFNSFYEYKGPTIHKFEHNKFYFEIKITITEKRIKLIIDIKYIKYIDIEHDEKKNIFHVSLFINKVGDAYKISSIHITKDNNILSITDPNEKKYVFIKLTNLFTIFFEYSKSDISTFIAHILQLLSEIFIIKETPKEEITKISSTKINNFVYDVCRKSVKNFAYVSGGRIQKNKTTAKPRATMAKPKATTAKPKATTAKPKATTAKPKATTAKPKATTAKPKATTSKPKATTAKPKATTAKPKATMAKPKATTAKPKATTAKPKATMAKPKATTAKPKATTAKPKATTAKPKATMAKPKATTAKPKATTAKPKATTAKPRAITKSSSRKKTS